MTKTRRLLKVWSEAGDYDDYELWDYDDDDDDFDGYGDDHSDCDDQLDVSCNYQQAVEALERNTWTFLWSSPLV